MLCELAHSFPPRIAELLERDRGLTRNFREETVTDLLMASLVGLEAFGIRVDFPDEPTTGGDMDWIFAAPLEINGGRYLRVLLQAKRAQFVKRKKSGGYWYYHHLAHGMPPGQQAQTLISHSKTSPGGMATLPVYAFYHPASALAPASASLPAIEGMNLVFAHHVAPTVAGGCSIKQKKVDHWRDLFMPLSDLLCWPVVVRALGDPAATDATDYVLEGAIATMPELTGAFHPDVAASRFRRLWEVTGARPGAVVDAPLTIEPANEIPQEIARAIEGDVTAKDRAALQRPRVILSTQLRRTDPGYAQAEASSRRQR